MRYRIEVLTPVHIFDRRVQAFEIVISDKRIALLNESSLALLLSKRGLICEFCDEATRSGFTVERFLKSHGISDVIPKISSRTIDHPSNTRPSNLQVSVVDGVSQEPYIPASSIKGYIRTALLFKMLRDDQCLLSRHQAAIEDSIKEARNNGKLRRKLQKNIGKSIDGILQQADLDGANERDPHTDWFRSVRLTDAHLEAGNVVHPTKIYSTGLFSLQKDPARNGMIGRLKPGVYINVEALRPGIILNGRLSVDTGLLGLFRPRGGYKPFNSVNDLLDTLDKFSRDVLTAEVTFYRDFGFPNLAKHLEGYISRANLRIGWGGGYLARSVGLAFDKSFRELIRDIFYKPRSGFPFPKSQKIIVDHGLPVNVLGWARLTVEE